MALYFHLIKQQLVSLCIVTRLYMCVIVAAGVLSGFYLCERSYPSIASSLGSLSMFLVAASGFVFNAVFDVRQDLTNEPSRPIPSGLMSIAAAWTIAFILLLSGVTIAQLLGTSSFRYTILVALVVTIYSPVKFWSGIGGNVTVGWLAASCPIFGTITTGQLEASCLVCAALTFCYNLGREMAKDVPHRMGDTEIGMRTLATNGDTSSVLRLAYHIMVLAVLIDCLFLLYRGWGNWTVVISILCLWALAMARLRRTVIGQEMTAERVGQFLRESALIMPIGAASFLFF